MKVSVIHCWLWLKLPPTWKTEKHCNLSTSSQYSLPWRVNCDLDLIYQPSREVPAGSLEPPGPAPLPHLSSRQATSWSRLCDCPFMLVCAQATGSFIWFIWPPGERHARRPLFPHSLLLRVQMKVRIFFPHWDAPVPNKWSCDRAPTQRRGRVNSPAYFLFCNFLFSYQVCFERGWDFTHVCLLKQHFIINAAKNSSYANTLTWSRCDPPSVCSPAHVLHALLFQQWILEAIWSVIYSHLLASRLRNSGNCDKVNDNVAPDKAVKGSFLCFQEEVKYSFNKRQLNTSVKETKGTFPWLAQMQINHQAEALRVFHFSLFYTVK